MTLQPRRTIDDASEDDQLAAAIAASLQNGSDSEGFDDEEETKEEAIEEEEEEEVFETLEPEPAGMFGLCDWAATHTSLTRCDVICAVPVSFSRWHSRRDSRPDSSP